MSSLADSFLADFERQDDNEDEQQIPSQTQISTLSNSFPVSASSLNLLDHNGQVKIEDEISEEQNLTSSHPTTETPSSLSVLLTSGSLDRHLSAIQHLLSLSSNEIDISQEYTIISTSTALSLTLDTEIAIVHKFLRDLYSHHYAELEQLVVSPLEYAKIVEILGNFQTDTDMRLMEKELQSIIPNNIVLTISVTANTSRGKMLTEEENRQVKEACQTIIKLDEAKKDIHHYIASRMNFMAANLSALIGTELAARLITTAGGLKRLSEIPACNIQVLGNKKQRLSALSSITQDLHVGLIAQSHIIQTCPTLYRKKAVRLLAGKISLAARIDEYKEDISGAKGQAMFNDILEKIDLWLQPAATSKDKALPVPVTTAVRKKHRGGRRYRKEKERYAVTELQKQKNRMAFGKEELVDEYTGEEFGMIGQHEAGHGRIGVSIQNTQKLSKKLSKDMQRRLAQEDRTNPYNNHHPHNMATPGGNTSLGTSTVFGRGGGGLSRIGGAVTVIGGGNLNGGTVSTIATSSNTINIELVNNEQKKVQQELQKGGEKYFSATSVFTRVGHKNTTTETDKKPMKPQVPLF